MRGQPKGCRGGRVSLPAEHGGLAGETRNKNSSQCLRPPLKTVHLIGPHQPFSLFNS